MYATATPFSATTLAHRAQVKSMARRYETVAQDKVGNGTFRLIRDVMANGMASYWFTIEVADKRAISSITALSGFDLPNFDEDTRSVEGLERGFTAMFLAEVAHYRADQD